MAQGFVDRCHIKDVGMCFFGIAVSIQAGANWTQSREISEGWQSTALNIACWRRAKIELVAYLIGDDL